MATLRGLTRRLAPPAAVMAVREAATSFGAYRRKLELARLRARAVKLPPGSVESCGRFRVRLNDGFNYFILYKDLFVNGIYHFDAVRPDPVIVDCGSNIGMSVLYFKHLYPDAAITAFEPDPTVFAYLEENVRENRLQNVRLVRAALGDREGLSTLHSDGKYGSYVAGETARERSDAKVTFPVDVVRLREYLAEPVDFLKMNIEGAECAALVDSADRLRQVREMVIEYHHLPGLPRTLHTILSLLHHQGFEYSIGDFDAETNPELGPPFHLDRSSRYFLLVYARRL